MSNTNIENQLRVDNAELTRQIALLEEALLEQNNAGEALQNSEKRYRRLFESAKDGILILDSDTGKVVDVNPFLLQLLGYSHEALSGQYIWELGVFKDIAASKDAFKTLQDNEYIRYDDLPLETLAGKPVAVEFVSNVYYVDHSRVIQCNIRDITARKQAESEHLRLTAQFQQLQKMEAVGLLESGVAHDYNNMLTVIICHAELALRKAVPGQPLYVDIEQIIEAAKHSTTITRQLLTFARKHTFIPVVLDLSQNVESMVKFLRHLIGEDINLVWLPVKNPCPVRMDPAQVNQILANLCINARDAIIDVGRITIETANIIFDELYCADHKGFVAGEYVMLAVSDDGSGMDKETLVHIFEPFFTTKIEGKGTGLGLSTVLGIVKQNNGFIDVHSKTGQGTTFKIYLPRYADETTNEALESSVEAPLSQGETVLVVEDEPAVLDIVKMMLEELGYRVLTARKPADAIRLAEGYAAAIQLLITDVVMPEMNGLDLVKRMQLLYPEMKILFMSGYSTKAIGDPGVLDGGVNFIQKPFSMKDLAEKIRMRLDNVAEVGR